MSEEMQLALEHTLKTMRELKEAKAEIERLRAALENIIILSDDYHKAVPIARAALTQEAAHD